MKLVHSAGLLIPSMELFKSQITTGESSFLVKMAHLVWSLSFFIFPPGDPGFCACDGGVPNMGPPGEPGLPGPPGLLGLPGLKEPKVIQALGCTGPIRGSSSLTKLGP